MNKLIPIRFALLAALLVTSFAWSSASLAQPADVPFLNTPCAGKVTPIGALAGGGVLYKAENVHGGRGPSFLVQNAQHRTNKQTLEIRDAYCRPIAAIGLFRTDSPYGSRYYMRTGGTGQSDTELLALAQKAGSTNILIEGLNGSWIRVRDPRNREGSVQK